MKRPVKNELYKGKKRRVRRKPSSSTVMPDKRMRTDILQQIQNDNYISSAGVDYDKDEVDRLLILRANKRAQIKNAKELREFEKYEQMKKEGKLVDEQIESQVIEREFDEDCIF